MSQRRCSYSQNAKCCIHCGFAMIFQFQLQLTGKSRQKWRKFCVQIYIEGKILKIAASAVNSSSSPTGLSYFFPRKLAKVMLSCSSLYLLMIHNHCLETAHSKFCSLIGFNKKNIIKPLSTGDFILSLSSQNCTSPRGMVSFLKNILLLILITLPSWISFCLWKTLRAY